MGDRLRSFVSGVPPLLSTARWAFFVQWHTKIGLPMKIGCTPAERPAASSAVNTNAASRAASAIERDASFGGGPVAGTPGSERAAEFVTVAYVPGAPRQFFLRAHCGPMRKR